MAKYQAKLNVYLAKSDRHFDKDQVYDLDKHEAQEINALVDCLELVEELSEELVEVETSTF
ncbi:hypothetical protein [Streptococcus oralis]|uniref:hypothetical protein n=1 Tax=Streptococcus oralis TaxID=1303 RepID=UPI002001CB21|nr:hypothetical protein [Streptococcus oralis]